MDAQETGLFTSIIISTILVGIIILFLLISIIRHQRKTIALTKKNTLAEITTQEKERARIAADLHDELGPRISTIKMNINSFFLTDEEDIKQLQKSNENLSEIIKRLREISFDLMPASLLSKGIAESLQQYIDHFGKSRLLVKLYSTGDELVLPESTAINIYRIIQEIIHNTFKHSEASLLEIFFKVSNDILEVKTVDNGKGFNFHESVSNANGRGLNNILRRVELLGSELYVASTLKNGTTYNFEIRL